MSTDDPLIREAKRLVETIDKEVKAIDKEVDQFFPHEITDIVKFHSKCAAAVVLVMAVLLTGAGKWLSTAAVLTVYGFIFSMYVRIGKTIGLPFGKNVVKSLAAGFASFLAIVFCLNIAWAILSQVIASGIVLEILRPLIVSAICYVTFLASGYVYLRIMTTVFRNGISLASVYRQAREELFGKSSRTPEQNSAQKKKPKGVRVVARNKRLAQLFQVSILPNE